MFSIKLIRIPILDNVFLTKDVLQPTKNQAV